MGQYFNILFLLSSFIITSACNNEVEDVNHKADHSTFAYDKVSVDSFEIIATDSNWPDIKDKAIVNLSTCMVDTAYLDKIVGEKFSVTSQMTRSSDMTNASGCLHWTEEFEFNSLNDENYYIISGKIIGNNHYKGEKDYSIALNPWMRKGVDLTNSRINKSISIKSRMFKTVTSSLQVPSVNVNIVQRKYTEDSARLILEFQTTPELTRKNLSGGIDKTPLTGGTFTLNSFLLKKNLDSQDRVIIARTSSRVVVGQDGIIKKRIEFDLNSGMDTNARLEFGFELIAKDDSKNVGSDSGVIGVAELKGSTSAQVSSLPLSFTSLSKNQENLNLKIDSDDIGFAIDKGIIFSKGSETGQNARGMDREVIAEIEMRIIDALIFDDVLDHTFDIDVIDMDTNTNIYSKREDTAKSSGSLIIRVKVPYLAYSENSWKKLKIKIKSNDSPYDGISKERIVYINPIKSGKDFGIDSAVGEPELTLADNTPEIFIDSFDYKFVDKSQNTFKLNKNLDLVFKHTMRITINPKLKTAHDYDGNTGYPAIFSGKYKLRLLVMAPLDPVDVDYTKEVNLDEYYVLTADELDVEIEDGQIIAFPNLPFSFKELMYFNLKNLALIELSPIDSRIKLKSGYFLGPMIGSKTHDTVAKSQISGQKLSTGNIDIAKSLIAKMDTVNTKLRDDRFLPDSFEMFLKQMKSIEQIATVFDYEKLSTKVAPVEIKVFKSENDFLRENRLHINKRFVTNLINSPENMHTSLVKQICHMLYDKNKVYKQTMITGGQFPMMHNLEKKGFEYDGCIKNPEGHITVKTLEHVRSIVENPKRVIVSTETLQRSVAYFISKGQIFAEIEGTRKTDFFQYGWSAHLGIEGHPLKALPLFGGISFGASGGKRTDIFTSKQKSELLSNQKRLINSSGQQLTFDRFNMSFVSKVKRCILITGKNHEIVQPKKTIRAFDFSDDKMLITNSNKQFYLCADEENEVERNESWYFVKLKRQSAVVDDSLMRNTLMNVVRGDTNFDVYRQTQVDSDRQLLFIESEDKEFTVDAYKKDLDRKGQPMDYKSRLGVGFPGLLE